MRLTLRTLLAYLDDTLAPSEAKLLGQKLAESEPAQEIVERIKNVIRRRRLTVPPATSRMDPNTIGEYLDNEITPELAEELERICLASDVHLAEVAACHQILTLILGEAPEVPDEVVKRMYALGKGMPTKPPKRVKKAPSVDKTVHHSKDADDTLRLGLPMFLGKDGITRWAMIVGGLLASLLLIVAVWQLLKPPVAIVDPPFDPSQIAKVDPSKKPENKGEPEVIKVLPKPEPVEEKKVEPTKEPKEPMPEPKEVKVPEGELPPPSFSGVIDKKFESAIAKVPYGPPSTKVVVLGQLLEPVKDQVSVLLQLPPKTSDWKRIAGKPAEVFSARPLVSLPGSKSTLVLAKGIKLTLWGNLPEHLPAPPVQESMVELYDHDVLDLDMTLRRGRIVLACLRDDGPVLVRIRFENPSDPIGAESHWILTLNGKGAEVMIDRWSVFPPTEPFFKNREESERKGPVAQMACLALGGTTFLKTPTETTTLQPPPSQGLAMWFSRANKLDVITMQALPPWLGPKATTPPEVIKARTELANAFATHAPDVAIAELLKAPDVLGRRMAVRCLGAVDDLAGLLDVIDQDKIEQRLAAVETLYQWIALSRDNDYKLFDVLRTRLKPNEAEVVMTLLHGFSEQAIGRPETYELLIEYLKHTQMSVRELAAWNLYRLVPAAQNILYDAGDATKRETAYRQWLKLIPPGKLPPAPPKMKTARDGGGHDDHGITSVLVSRDAEVLSDGASVVGEAIASFDDPEQSRVGLPRGAAIRCAKPSRRG